MHPLLPPTEIPSIWSIPQRILYDQGGPAATKRAFSAIWARRGWTTELSLTFFLNLLPFWGGPVACCCPEYRFLANATRWLKIESAPGSSSQWVLLRGEGIWELSLGGEHHPHRFCNFQILVADAGGGKGASQQAF